MIEQKIDETRTELPVGHGLFDRRKLQNGPQYRCHGPMAEKNAVVEDEMLKFTPFDRHQDRSMHRIGRGNRPLRTGRQIKRPAWAIPHTDAAPETGIPGQPYRFLLWIPWILGGNKGNDVHRTNIDTGSTAGTIIAVQRSNKIRRVDGLEKTELPGGDHRLAAAAAAIANETHPIPDVFAELDEVQRPGLLEQVQPLFHTYGSGITMADQ